MNKDQFAGSAKEARGTVKEMAGKAIGDTKLKSAGKIEGLWGHPECLRRAQGNAHPQMIIGIVGSSLV